jgi:arginine exporter protein ArgO
MYESILQSSPLVRILVCLLPVLLIVLPFVKASLKKGSENRNDDNVMTAALRFVGSAFIFIGSFANVTAWQGASSANSSLKNELASLSALSETILDYKQDATLSDAISKITTYVQTIHDTELSENGIKGVLVEASGLNRTQKTKNSALGVTPAIMRNSAEQQALDIRSAVIAIEQADIVNERDLNRMLKQVDDFQTIRRTRLSGTWPIVPLVVIVTFLVITLATLVLIGCFPTGPSKKLKWMQVIGSVAVVSSVWFSVLSTQDVSVNSSRFNAPIEAFLNRYK